MTNAVEDFLQVNFINFTIEGRKYNFHFLGRLLSAEPISDKVIMWVDNEIQNQHDPLMDIEEFKTCIQGLMIANYAYGNR